MNDRTITIGKFIANNQFASMDLNYLMELKLLIMAMTGGGKSHGTRIVLEKSFPLIQHIILDGENEYYTLREKFPYLLFGSMEDNADVQIHPKLAEVLPETLMKIGKSAVIDISELAAHERDIFVMKFLQKLLDIPKHLRHPCLVVLDEAQKYCPEKGYGQSIASNAVKDFVARCRKRKFTAIFCTQRPAALSKDVTGACGMKLIGYAGQEEDRARNARELGMSTKPQDTMIFSKLGKPNYQFYAFGNGLSAEPMLMKFEESQTTHSNPDAFGDKKPPATPDQLKKILSELQDLPQQAEQELKTQAEMKQKISKLESELKVAKSSSPQTARIDPQALQKAHDQGYEKGMTYCDNFYQSKLKILKLGYDKLTINLAKIPKLADAITLAATITDGIDFNINGIMIQKPEISPEVIITKTFTATATKPITIGQPITNEDIVTGHLSILERKILIAIAQRNPQQANKQQISLVTEYSIKSSGFDKALANLKRSGFMEGTSESFTITAAGLEELGDFEPLASDPAQLREFWIGKVGPGCGKMLRTICDAHPDSISKQDIAEKSGFSAKSSGFDKNLARLSSTGLIDRVSAGQYKASQELF